MPDLVQFELVSPERLILSTEVEMVVVPGTEGNFGVLPGHAPLISTIRPGTIDIYQGGAVSERIFVVSGIAEVTPERCTVLADEAMAPDALDRSTIEAELQTAEGNLPTLREQIGRAQGAERERLATELRHVEETVIGRGKLRPERIGQRRWEQRKDLAPAEEHDCRQHDEDQRVIAKGDHDRDRRSLHQKSDGHRVLAADLVGQPAEKRPCQAVGDAIDG